LVQCSDHAVVPTFLEVDRQQKVLCLPVVHYPLDPTAFGCLEDVDPSFVVVLMVVLMVAQMMAQMEVLMVDLRVVN